MLFGLFKKSINIAHEVQQDPFDLSRLLIKEATQLKKTNIEKAIKKIQKAINICPEKVTSDYFKLANYIQIAGRHDESFSVLCKLMSELDPNDYYLFNMHRSSISEKMMQHLFREKKYVDCIWSGCETDWLQFVALACQGRFNGIEGYALFLDSRNAKKSFKEINLADKLDDFKKSFQDFLMANSDFLRTLSNSSPGLTNNNLSDEFTMHYQSLNKDIFAEKFKKEFQLLLNEKKKDKVN